MLRKSRPTTPRKPALAASAGSEHADNVSAAICGGFVIVRSYNPLKIVNLRAPEDMEVCVAYPHMATPARKTELLPAPLGP